MERTATCAVLAHIVLSGAGVANAPSVLPARLWSSGRPEPPRLTSYPPRGDRRRRASGIPTRGPGSVGDGESRASDASALSTFVSPMRRSRPKSMFGDAAGSVRHDHTARGHPREACAKARGVTHARRQGGRAHTRRRDGRTRSEPRDLRPLRRRSPRHVGEYR